MNHQELIKRSHKQAVDKGFWVKPLTFDMAMALIISEIAEALEAYRKGWYNTQPVINTVPDDFEEWKEIEGYNGEYEVSNLGRVRSLDMIVFGGKAYYEKKGRVLSPGLASGGYYSVSLKGKTYKVCRLVAKAFCEGYKKGLVVNHINGIKTDDFSNNLEWVSSSENNKHALKTGLRDMTKILSKEEMIQIAFLAKSKIPHKEIHEKYPQVSLGRIKGISRIKEQFTESLEFEIADAIIRIYDWCGGIKIFPDLDVPAHYLYDGNEGKNFMILFEAINYTWDVVSNDSNKSNYCFGYLLNTLLSYCKFKKIEIEKYVKWKLDYNLNREYLHGKKF